MHMNRRDNLNIAIDNLSRDIQARDIPEAIFDANALTCVGSGFPLFSCGWRIARHLQKSIYYHADKVTVHDSDLGYLKQIVDARYHSHAHGLNRGTVMGYPPMFSGMSSVRVHDKNGTHYHVTARYSDKMGRVHVTDGAHDSLANHNEAVADGKEAL